MSVSHLLTCGIILMSANNSTQHITKIDLLKRTIAYDIPMQFPLRTCLCLSHSLSLAFSILHGIFLFSVFPFSLPYISEHLPLFSMLIGQTLHSYSYRSHCTLVSNGTHVCVLKCIVLFRFVVCACLWQCVPCMWETQCIRVVCACAFSFDSFGTCGVYVAAHVCAYRKRMKFTLGRV